MFLDYVLIPKIGIMKWPSDRNCSLFCRNYEGLESGAMFHHPTCSPFVAEKNNVGVAASHCVN